MDHYTFPISCVTITLDIRSQISDKWLADDRLIKNLIDTILFRLLIAKQTILIRQFLREYDAIETEIMNAMQGIWPIRRHRIIPSHLSRFIPIHLVVQIEKNHACIFVAKENSLSAQCSKINEEQDE